MKLAAKTGPDRVALIGAYCVAGHSFGAVSGTSSYQRMRSCRTLLGELEGELIKAVREILSLVDKHVIVIGFDEASAQNVRARGSDAVSPRLARLWASGSLRGILPLRAQASE